MHATVVNAICNCKRSTASGTYSHKATTPKWNEKRDPRCPRSTEPTLERRDLLAFLASLDGARVGALAGAAQPSPKEIANVITPRAEDWPTYNGRVGGNRHSDLTQNHRADGQPTATGWNMHVLPFTGLQVTPIVVGGVMYVTGSNAVCALDARAGRQLWCYTRTLPAADAGGRGARGGGAGNQPPPAVGGGGIAGFAAFGTGNRRGGAVLGDRVFFTTPDAHLIALHRLTGGVLWDVAMVPAGVPGQYQVDREPRSSSAILSLPASLEATARCADSSPRSARSPVSWLGGSGRFLPGENLLPLPGRARYSKPAVPRRG